MSDQASQILNIGNGSASVSVDLFGGALTGFSLKGNAINPLGFKYPPEKMPDNNKPGAAYQGHFVCIGRWGLPSQGEIKAGLPNHGQAANLLWSKQASGEKDISMQVMATLEGLQVNRDISLDDTNAVFKVTESVKNINPLGRMYNVVQHPALSAPFLTNRTVVNCNADKGFNYAMSTKPLAHTVYWPYGVMEDLGKINLSEPDKTYNSLFSFAVKKNVKFGWITAWSPENNLLLGYLWQREDYPWISFWQDFDGDNIRYRGLEFGTTGMHKPFNQIIAEDNHRVFNEDSYKYIDAGETQSRAYIAFTCATPEGFVPSDNLSFEDGKITIGKTGRQIIIQTSLTI